MVSIRHERPGDIEAVRAVNEPAFGQADEADIVDALRQNCDGLLSLVAVDGGEIVGHCLFSPVVIEGVVHGMGLAPMAVRPQHQGRGVGSALIGRGLELLKNKNFPFVIVLGHAKYYPRFGFEKASLHGVMPQWDGIPDEAFMIAVLDEEEMRGVRGVARYRQEFDAAV